MSWMTTHSGRHFDFLNPTVGMVDWEDIAYSLSRIHRFNGHTIGLPYTVAEHSIRVARRFSSEDRQAKLYALLHDTHETYTGDITSPLKFLLDGKLTEIQDRIQVVIHKYFGLPEQPSPDIARAIKLADHSALLTEKRDLMPDDGKDWSEWCTPGAEEWPNKIIPAPGDATYWMFKQELFNLWQP